MGKFKVTMRNAKRKLYCKQCAAEDCAICGLKRFSCLTASGVEDYLKYLETRYANRLEKIIKLRGKIKCMLK